MRTKILRECKIINASMDTLKAPDATEEKKQLALVSIECAVKNIEYFANSMED